VTALNDAEGLEHVIELLVTLEPPQRAMLR